MQKWRGSGSQEKQALRGGGGDHQGCQSDQGDPLCSVPSYISGPKGRDATREFKARVGREVRVGVLGKVPPSCAHGARDTAVPR